METAIINGICRCCASEGAFKDIRSAYQWMGAEEIYADMLKECFDLSLWSSGEGDDGGICEVCVTQLRNASNFKKQVLHTEEQFKKHLHTRLFKPSIVKVELPANDGIDSDDNISAEEGYSGTDYEVSAIKVESPEESKPKKRSAKMSTRASTSRAKKAKGDAGESSTKRVQNTYKVEVAELNKPRHKTKVIDDDKVYIIVSTESNKNSPEPLNELGKHRSNIRLILQLSNATPIRCRGGIGYACSFCREEYPDPADLKKHTLEEHNKAFATFMGPVEINRFLIKLDITNLQCNVCEVDIDSLESLITHITNIHQMEFFTDIKNHIMPFKFDDCDLKCVYCHLEFAKFINLQQHMHIHRMNYVCVHCGTGYVNKHCLLNHLETHKTGVFKCNVCPKIFDTLLKKKSHENHVHKHAYMLCRCGYCNQKFSNTEKKDTHMYQVHGVPIHVYKCDSCEKTFRKISLLQIHVRRDHLKERSFLCHMCEAQFFTLQSLQLHMVKHTGKEYQCDVCMKTYATLGTLKVHQRIHNGGPTFKCQHCGRAFVQKSNLTRHLHQRHGNTKSN